MGKIKVSELAEQLGIPASEIIEAAKKLGEDPKTISSTLEDSTAAKIRMSILLRRPSTNIQESPLAKSGEKRTSLFADVDKKKVPTVKAATAEAVELAKAAEAAMMGVKEPPPKKTTEIVAKVSKTIEPVEKPAKVVKKNPPPLPTATEVKLPTKKSPSKVEESNSGEPLKTEKVETSVIIKTSTKEVLRVKEPQEIEEGIKSEKNEKTEIHNKPVKNVETPKEISKPGLKEPPKPEKKGESPFDRPVAMPKRVEPTKLPPLPVKPQTYERPILMPKRVEPTKLPPIPTTTPPPIAKREEKKEMTETFYVDKEHFVVKRKTHKPRSHQGPKPQPKPVVVKPQKLTIEVFAKTAGVPEQRIMSFMLKHGLIPNPEEELNGEVLELISSEFGLMTSKEGKLSGDNLAPRSPIVTIMGHVDHGKTTLLDYIRKTQVAAGEAGGITQSIGAYKVVVGDRSIVFIDTPGHEAFAAMRREGANVTDIVILVIAADEGVKEQTIEALNMAKEAKVAIIVAANKMDRPGANLDKLRSQLAELGLTPEDWGGDTMIATIIAKTGEGVPNLLEMIILQTDMLELKMNKAGKLAGTIIESHMDRFVGPLATAVVQSGILKVGDYIEAGQAWGRVKALYDDHEKRVNKIPAVTPVKIMGFDTVPKPGSILLSSDVSRKRKTEKGPVLIQSQQPNQATTDATSLDDLFKAYEKMEATKLNVVVKADSEGTLEAVRFAVSKIKIKDIPANIVYASVGVINDNDVLLADAAKAMLVGFNVQVDPSAKKTAKQNDIPINTYNIIFELTDAIVEAIKKLIAPEFRDVKVGAAEVREVFTISDFGNIAGCMMTEGFVRWGVKVIIVRNRMNIYETKLRSLKRFKEDAHEVKAGYECGIGLENYNDMKVGDILEFYQSQEVQTQ